MTHAPAGTLRFSPTASIKPSRTITVECSTVGPLTRTTRASRMAKAEGPSPGSVASVRKLMTRILAFIGDSLYWYFPKTNGYRQPNSLPRRGRQHRRSGACGRRHQEDGPAHV